MIDRTCSLIKMQVPLRNRGLLFASGTVVPTDGTDGYQTGCIFQHTDGGDNDALYVNEGSVTSCDFNSIGDLTTVDYSAGGTTAITISGTYTVEGILIQRSCTRGLRVGEFASGGVATSAMILDATTPTAVEIHAGLSADPGSGTMARPLRSRCIIASVGNVEAETYGMQGQLVVKSSNLGHWHGGVLGTIECQTALSVYNPLAGVGALVGRIGGSTITVQSSSYLAGVIGLASAVGVSNSGVYAGLYVTKTSGASNFGHGAYIENSDIGIYASVTTQAFEMIVATLPANARGARLALTCATPAMTDGYGAFEIDLTVSSTATGKTAATSTWLNLGGSATIVDYNHVHTDGIWDGGATLSAAYISWAKYQCLLQSDPAWCSLWELNFDGANSEVDSLFNVNSLILSLGYQAGTPTKAAVGSIPFCSEAGGQLRYIYLYDEADAD